MSNRADPGERLALQTAATQGRRRGGAQQQQGSSMGAIFNVFPLILIPVLIYNVWAFANAGSGDSPSARRFWRTWKISSSRF